MKNQAYKSRKEARQTHYGEKLATFGRKISHFPLSASLCRKIRQRRGQPYVPPVGRAKLGDLRRLTPLCREFGYRRGLPIDRYYMEKFLAHQAADISGRVLEIGDNNYTRRFGGDRVITSDVLHVSKDNPKATYTGDLTDAEHLPANTFDCAIITQTFHLIYDIRSALKTIYRILKPAGVLLATVPGISQISIDEWADSWYWSFTVLSAQRLLQEVFPVEHVTVNAFGNVLAATAFLNGLAAQELRPDELAYCDSHYQLLITIRAVKPMG